MANKKVPLFALYQKKFKNAQPRYLHLETVRQFTGLHGEVVKPHRHIDLHHFIWLEQGGASVVLDGQKYTLQAPFLIVVPPPVIHSVVLSKGAGGHCLTLASSYVADLLAQMGKAARWRFEQAAVVSGGIVQDHVANMNTLFEALARARDNNKDTYTAITMFAYGIAIMAEVMRVLERQPGQLTARSCSILYNEFHALVESHFQLRWQLPDFASALGVSERTLQRACKAVTGHTPNDIIQQRVTLQAKRELLYTRKTIAEVAETLGFSEVSAFSHFFSRAVGMPPSRFRRCQDKTGVCA